MFNALPLSLLLMTFIQTEDTLAVYPLPKIVNQQKVYPGIKDLPSHIRTNFRNLFIRPVIQDIFNSEQPWVNPDLSALQLAYDNAYPAYPARLQWSDAVVHPVRSCSHNMMGLSNSLNQTVTSLGVVRNRIGAMAVQAVHQYLTTVFRQKRLKTLSARAKHVSEQFKSNDDHPFIWRQYVVGDIANHPETGGYQTVCAGLPCWRPSCFLIVYRPAVVSSSANQFWRHCLFITLHPGLWSLRQLKTQEKEIALLVPLPWRPPLYATPSQLREILLI